MLKKSCHFCHLLDRVIISLKGKEVHQILQGITSNDIRLLKQSQSTLFMNTNGRILSEAIIHKPQILKLDKWEYCNDEIWLDINESMSKPLLQHIKKFLIRKKVDIQDYSDQLKVFQVYGQEMQHKQQEGESIYNQTDELSEEQDDYRNLVSIDPRSSIMGLRMITPDIPGVDKDAIKVENLDHYDLYRLQEGIFEGREVQNRIPYAVNFDFWNSINLTKGCYVGQELLARSYHNGVIRKRMLPFRIQNGNNKNLQDSQIMLQDIEIGKVIFCKENIGVALVNYLEVDLNKEYKIEDLMIQFILNDKLQSKVQDYIKLVQSKQQ